MAGRPGSIGLLEALKMAQDRYDAEQASKKPAAPFNFGQTVRDADKAIQAGVFGVTDAIGAEGKRLIDGKFGFDALAQSLPQLAQSGPSNLAEALATTPARVGGGWTNTDLQAQRDRDNLGMAAGGALDASLLVPGLGAVPKGAYKAVGKTMAGAVDNMMPAEIARDVERVYSVPTKFGDLELNVFPRGKSAEVTWDWAAGVPREGIDAAPVSAGREAMRAVKGSLARDAKATKQPAYTFSGTSDAHTRLYSSMLNDPDLSFKPMKDAGSDTLGMQRKMLGGPVEVPDWAKGLKPQIDDGAAPDFMGDPELWRKYDSRAADRPQEATTLGMGFPFGGKDGEKPLSRALMDMFKGKPKESPLDQFTPPTTLDDIFTGGAPRGPRELSGGTEYPAGLDSSFMNDPRFNGAGVQDPVPYDPAKGFQGLDARFAQSKKSPMEQQLEKLREQGWNGPWYRGMNEPFDPTKARTAMFAKDPDYASSFANMEGGNVTPFMLKDGVPVEYKPSAPAGLMTDKPQFFAPIGEKNAFTQVEDIYDHMANTGQGTAALTDKFAVAHPQYASPIADLLAQSKNAKTLSEALAKRAKPPGYDDWSPEWRAAYDKGLDMSTEARMARAREQGFNVDERLYHGTWDNRNMDFDAFDPKYKFGEQTKESASWFTPNPRTADLFNSNDDAMRFGGGQTMPVYTRGRLAQEDYRGAHYNDETVPIDLEDARHEGFDGVRFKNMQEYNPFNVLGPNESAPRFADQIAIFDPANIRSTSAAFDPANARKPTLLGMGAPFEGKAKGIKAYHGSPHDFDRFDMSKIGTGEGAQAYGHGLYFAENEGVAKAYRDTLADPILIDKRGKPTKVTPDADQSTYGAALSLMQNDGNFDAAIAEVRNAGGLPYMRQQQIAELERMRREGYKLGKSGHMYEVNINADPESFLDWDKPLSEQPIGVRDKAAQIAAALYGKDADWLNPYGKHMVQENKRALETGLAGRNWQKADVIKESGIPGIKYLDQGSRTAGDGSRNYVVFDDKLVDINRKYMGIPPEDLLKVLMAYGAFGGMSAGALATMESQKHQQGGM